MPKRELCETEYWKMSDQPLLSAAASLLRPFVNAVLTHVSRLRAERQASQMLAIQPTDLMDNVLNETLGRLRGGSIEDVWWRNILAQFGQQYISPDFLRKPALQEWLAEERVATDFKTLATTNLMMGVEDNEEARTRLIESYSDRTGEADQLATGPINVVIAVLVAGYIASIPSDQRASTGISQAGFKRMDARFDRLEALLPQGTPDPIIQKFHTEEADVELSKVLRLRAIDPPASRSDIQILLNRTRGGDLVAASNQTKADILYWAVRLLAVDTDTLATARELREELEQSDPRRDLSILDALFATTMGNSNDGLRIIRDKDDPDSRSVFFSILADSQGESAALDWYEQHEARDDPDFFTGFGWRNWAICTAKRGKWEETCRQLIKVETYWSEAPFLAFVEGSINSAMLLPLEYRNQVLDHAPLYAGINVIQRAKVEQHHARATICFEYVTNNFADFAGQHFTNVVSDWQLWLRLMDPNLSNATATKQEISQRMNSGSHAVNLILFAHVFDIEFDAEPLTQHLARRKQLGGLNERELLAECLLFNQSISPRDFVTYLEQHRTRLSKLLHPAFLTIMHVDALVRDGQTKRARALVAGHAADLGEGDSNRLTVMIDDHEGSDPREQLEHLYRETGQLIDLKNLISYLKTVDDRAALQPLVIELFDCETTIKNALDVVRCLGDPSCFDHESVIEFLETNGDLVVQNDDLKAVKAWALFQSGRLQDAKDINDDLLRRRSNQDDFHLDVYIAVSSGHWERVSAIIDREWPKRDSHDAETLMQLACLSGQRGQEPDHALELASLAAQKAPDDPRILAAAYWLHFKLGRDGEADPKWLMRASALSSTDEGPIWPVDLRDAVNDLFPKRRDLLQEIERKWLGGEIPMSVAAGVFNVSLARLLLHIPDQNAARLDGRPRVILPIISGGRSPVELQKNWTIGLDVTSVMVLAYLDLLEQTIEAFHHVKLAPDIMEFLFRERDETRFHQPSRIAAAKEVRVLESAGKLQAANSFIHPPDALVDEVGLELAMLLHMAEHDGGMVVCVQPIHRPESLMEQFADTSAHDHLILSTMDICTLLHEEGKIDTEDYQRATMFLKSQGQKECSNLRRSSFNGPVYIDNLALSYLQDANILQPVAAAGLNIRVHPNVLKRAHAFIEEGDVGHELGTKIEGIRTLLRNAVDNGAASFLPRTANRDERIQNRAPRFQATATLLAGTPACDALCIDDRYINSHANITDDTGQNVPIACVLDVIRHLSSRGVIDIAGHWTARHKLRRSGFAFIPLESDELMHWLTAARVDDGRMRESAELRILRQTMANIDFLGLSSLKEAATLSTNLDRVCKTAIDRVWEDASFTVEQAGALSDWVWHHLMKTAVLAREQIAADNRADWVRDLISLRLGYLLMPMTIQSEERRIQFADWIEQSVIEPLRPANADTIEKALATMCDKISALEDHHEVYGNLFLEQLPSSARKVVISKNPEFSERCGFKTESVLEIGPEIKLAESKLVKAVREVFANGAEKTIQDTSGKDVSISVDRANQNIVVTWTDSEGTSQHASLRELAILSPSQQTRINSLRSITDRMGATGPEFLYSSNDLDSRELNKQELASVFAESANGVAAVQSRLVQKLDHGLPIGVTDIVPQDISYFERFCGPAPDTRKPELYFREILIPYRQELLQRNIRAGLDICFLGALRDDLAPGQWLADVHVDVVWDALASCHAKENPFSLLGALDVALYRQDDERFEEFAAEAVTTLSNERFGRQDGPDLYMLLQVLFDFVLNRINLIENGATYPGYWKRMCAWMQAGMIARALSRPSISIDPDSLEEWLRDNMTAAGDFAGLVDARDEPMLFASRITARVLKNEILGRLRLLRWRHESEGRQVPRSNDLDQALARATDSGEILVLEFPGPLEGHRRPTELIPQELSEKLEEADVHDPETCPLQPLVTVSQLFAVGEPELDHARKTVRELSHEVSESNLKCLASASIVAAANRDTILADDIADAAVRMAPQVTQGEEIHKLFQFILQAVAAHEAHDTWFQWIEERLTYIAIHLPSPPNNCLKVFQDHLDEIGKVLPIDSWFQVRARSIASSGMA